MSATLAELKAAGRRAAEIEAAISQYRHAMATLAEVNKHVKSNQVWRPTLRLDKGKESWNGPVRIEIVIPAGMYQASGTLEVHANEKTMLLRMKHVRQRGVDFERVSYEPL